MKQFIFILILCFGASAPSETFENVKQKTKNAAKSAVNFSKEKKDKFVAEMEDNIASIKKEIAELKAKATDKSQEKIAQLEAKQESLEKDLGKAKNSSGRAWEKMKKGISKAWGQLKDSFSEAKNEIKN